MYAASRFPVPRSYQLLVKLTGWLPGQRSVEVDTPWALESGQVLSAIGQDFRFNFWSCIARVEQLHDGLHFFAKVFAGYAYDRHVGDLGVPNQHSLGLLRVNVDAA